MVPDQQPNGSGVSLDRETKSKIKRWVLALRAAFEKDFSQQLRRLGVAADIQPNGPPEYLTEDERQQRRRILTLVRREQQAEGARDKAIEAYVRDCTFTIINRLVGLRCMEARELLSINGKPAEAITLHGPAVHGGRPGLLAQMREESREYRNPADGEERLWRDGLRRACAAVSDDIRVLFDPDHDFSILSPTHATLMEAVRAINEDLPPEVYRAPDFLGWVYQFFNAEEKVAIREATKGKPRNSHELAVINQFYTPDWIVKFLVDNTLGRVWLQMHPDTRLYWRNRVGDRDPEAMTPEEKQQVMFQGVNIDYLVPDTGEDEPIPPKPVSEITLLDPACGTMHFGQYAYSIFYAMYLEEGVVPPEEIPNAILQNNLFGVDIDPRAIQIAALALLLTMKEQARVLGLQPEALRVRGMNLVCANSVNLGDEEREKLLKRLNPEMFGGDVPMKRAVEALWENLQHVGELGSLIQVDDSVERALGQVSTWRMKFVDDKQMTLGDEPEWGALQGTLTAEERTTARDYLLGELQRLAAGKGNGDMMAQLFAQETEKGLRLLEVLGRKYDAVVMNPPYGASTEASRAHLERHYTGLTWDIYACFVKRCMVASEADGYVGALTNRTFIYTPRLRALRDCLIVSERLLACLEMGLGELDDATVRPAAYIVRGAGLSQETFFMNLREEDDRHSAFVQALIGDSLRSDPRCYWVLPSEFASMPGTRIAYSAPVAVRRLFATAEPVQPLAARVRQGAQTGDDERFLRRWWELEPGSAFVFFAKGDGFSRFYSSMSLKVAWADWAVDALSRQGNCLPSRDLYFSQGLRFPNVGENFCCRLMDAPCVFSAKEQAVIPNSDNWGATLLGLLNATLTEYLLALFNIDRQFEVSHVASLPLPMCAQTPGSTGECAMRAHLLKSEWDQGNEICARFTVPYLLGASDIGADIPASASQSRLSSLLAHCLDREEQSTAQCRSLLGEIDGIVYDLYEITPEDRELIERELGERPAETVWPQMAGKSREEKRLEHVLRLLSYIAKTVCEEDEDGIVPLVPCGEEPTLLERARRKLDEFFGADRGHEIEAEINSELRVRLKGNRNCGPRMDMETWFATRYFDYHVSLYKRRPIFWHIQSDDGSFGALCHYHKLNRNRLQKLRAHYLATFMDRLRREIGELQSDESKEARARLERLEGNLRSAEELSRKLGLILTGEPDPKTGEQYRIHVRWKSEEEQPKGWDPDIDDGVKVNITPLQEAGVLAARKVV